MLSRDKYGQIASDLLTQAQTRPRSRAPSFATGASLLARLSGRPRHFYCSREASPVAPPDPAIASQTTPSSVRSPGTFRPGRIATRSPLAGERLHVVGLASAAVALRFRA